MIAEREHLFTEEDYQNGELFPKYLILRWPVDVEGSYGQEW